MLMQLIVLLCSSHSTASLCVVTMAFTCLKELYSFPCVWATFCQSYHLPILFNCRLVSRVEFSHTRHTHNQNKKYQLTFRGSIVEWLKVQTLVPSCLITNLISDTYTILTFHTSVFSSPKWGQYFNSQHTFLWDFISWYIQNSLYLSHKKSYIIEG